MFASAMTVAQEATQPAPEGKLHSLEDLPFDTTFTKELPGDPQVATRDCVPASVSTAT